MRWDGELFKGRWNQRELGGFRDSARGLPVCLGAFYLCSPPGWDRWVPIFTHEFVSLFCLNVWLLTEWNHIRAGLWVTRYTTTQRRTGNKTQWEKVLRLDS